jgi:hypothetical protein
MFFDLTPEIILEKKSQLCYVRCKAFLYVLALTTAIILALAIIFPTRYFTFSFLNPNATSNTLFGFKDAVGNYLERGQILATQKFSFLGSLLGNFSKANITFKLNEASNELQNGKIFLQKSYGALLYSEGAPLGFKEGTLLENDGKFFIISDGFLRPFMSLEALENLGFNKEAFWSVSATELAYNAPGEPIKEVYPNGTIFFIADEYYILSGNKLEKFISSNAYFSQYSVNQAISQDANFLANYSLTEKPRGFADGSLLSYGESAFVVSADKIYPIDSVETFEAMGYAWADLIPASGEEISFYAKQKVMSLLSVHPNGTVFLTTDAKKNEHFYLTKDNNKYLLPSFQIARSWSRKTPIQESAESLFLFAECAFGPQTWFSRSFSCEANVENLQKNIGKDYQFTFSGDSDVQIDVVNLKFTKSYTFSNLQRFFTNVIKGLKTTYVSQEEL